MTCAMCGDEPAREGSIFGRQCARKLALEEEAEARLRRKDTKRERHQRLIDQREWQDRIQREHGPDRETP